MLNFYLFALLLCRSFTHSFCFSTKQQRKKYARIKGKRKSITNTFYYDTLGIICILYMRKFQKEKSTFARQSYITCPLLHYIYFSKLGNRYLLQKEKKKSIQYIYIYTYKYIYAMENVSRGGVYIEYFMYISRRII